VTLNSQVVVNTPGVTALTLNGFEGDDTFLVAGLLLMPAPRSPEATRRPATSLV